MKKGEGRRPLPLPVLRAEVKKLEDVHGHLEPDDLIRIAEPDDNVLHYEFTWDNEKAGHLWRLDEARHLLARVVIQHQYHNITYKVPEYVRDPEAKSQDQGYRNIRHIANDADLVRESLRSEMERLLSILDRILALAVKLKPRIASSVSSMMKIAKKTLKAL